jgi:hypothetical protein
VSSILLLKTLPIKGFFHLPKCFWSIHKRAKIYKTDDLKQQYAKAHPYAQWLAANRLTLNDLPEVKSEPKIAGSQLQTLWRRNGYTHEVIETALIPDGQKWWRTRCCNGV